MLVCSKYVRYNRVVNQIDSDIDEVKWGLTNTVSRAELRDLRDRRNYLEHQKTTPLRPKQAFSS
jgi:hypothetical protein